MTKKKKYIFTCRFNGAWLEMPQFKGWLQRNPDNISMAHCSVCICELRAHKRDLESHGCSRKHKINFAMEAPEPFMTKENERSEESDKRTEKRINKKKISSVRRTMVNKLKCRVCLDECSKEAMYDLFDIKGNSDCETTSNNNADEEQYESNDIYRLNMGEKLEYCCGIRLHTSPDMPMNICYNCNEIIQMWFNFRQLCVNSQIHLESNLCTEQTQRKVNLEDIQIFRNTLQEKHKNYKLNVPSAYQARIRDTVDKTIDVLESDNTSKIETVFEEVEVAAFSPPPSTPVKHNVELKQANVKKTARRALRPASPSSYMCNICGKICPDKSRFTYHMSMHSDIKPHKCEFCSKTFRRRGALHIHVRRHTGERPYKCAHCPRHFHDHTDRIRHERVHTNTRPYVCKYCDKGFIYSATYKDHLKMHSGVKEYYCFECDQSFTIRKNYAAHLLTLKHKQKKIELQSEIDVL